jgi:hypothetical protein
MIFSINAISKGRCCRPIIMDLPCRYRRWSFKTPLSIAVPFLISFVNTSLKHYRQKTAMKKPGLASTSRPARIGFQWPQTGFFRRLSIELNALKMKSQKIIGICLNCPLRQMALMSVVSCDLIVYIAAPSVC